MNSIKREEEVISIQKAIINVVEAEDKAYATKMIIEQMNMMPLEKRYRYFNVLSKIGSKDGLDILVNKY